MLVLVDAAQPADAQAAKAHHPCVSQEEDVGGGPPAVEQLPQVVGGLVVAADWEREGRGRKEGTFSSKLTTTFPTGGWPPRSTAGFAGIDN